MKGSSRGKKERMWRMRRTLGEKEEKEEKRRRGKVHNLSKVTSHDVCGYGNPRAQNQISRCGPPRQIPHFSYLFLWF